jgi:hypothetical protein
MECTQPLCIHSRCRLKHAANQRVELPQVHDGQLRLLLLCKQGVKDADNSSTWLSMAE